jgi:hypothetical protein
LSAVDVQEIPTRWGPMSRHSWRDVGILKTDTCKRIRAALPGPFTRLESVDETELTTSADASTAEDYMDLDGKQ